MGLIKYIKKKTSLFGGYILYLNLILIFLCDIFFELGNLNFIFGNENKIKTIFLFFIHFIFLIAVVDDRINIKALTRLVLLFIFCTMLIYSSAFTQLDYFKSYYFENLSLNNSRYIISILILISLINFLNFYDGINMQLGIFFNYILIYLVILEYNLLIIYFLIVNNIFLYFNFKNRMFFGDFGVYVVAIILSILLMYYYRNFDNFQFENIILLFFFPIIDFLRLIIKRIIRNKNPMYGDKDHIHHIGIKKYSLNKYNLIMSLIYSLNLLGLFLNLYLIVLLVNIVFYYCLIQKSFKFL